ncbi:hypothetical protein [Treponema endosymbiont of Eucomonympha sp.]|uniref:hypothetical protein n=1 Tax=Treponema endosymbiont of Eucomonympha sp. TaxID=1580831 RepID=UPI001396C309|nr:hypothetical protein [Treponema endosymbiont of Eucomonympha sp.]
MQSSPLPSSPPFMSGVCFSTFQSTLPSAERGIRRTKRRIRCYGLRFRGTERCFRGIKCSVRDIKRCSRRPE